MRKFYTTLLGCFASLLLYAQAPGIKWSRPIGGTSVDAGRIVTPTADGGFLIASETSSANGDVSGHHGGSDIWIVKMTSSGAIQWQKAFGGSGNEFVRKMIYLPDGGAAIMGITNSVNGDITDPRGHGDIWVFRIDASGNLLWSKALGGTAADELRNADKSLDNGFILTGFTSSNNFDVSGNHGGEDVWVVKLSSSGAIEWQKCLGGTGSERPRAIMAMADGSYVMTGSTASTNGDVTNQHGGNDLWVVKLDGSGNILWQKAYGGTQQETGFHCVLSSSGNSLVVLANTNSNDGDVSGYAGSVFSTDVWVVDVSYANGTLNWQRCIGGFFNESPIELIKDADGNYLASMTTNSGDRDAVTTHGSNDVLLMRLNTSGTPLWSKCFGGSRTEQLQMVLNDTSGRSYVLAATTSSLNGDVTGYHQPPSHPSDSANDAWVLKVDYSGNLKWQKALGGTGIDALTHLQKTGDNSYILTGQTSSSDGDLDDPRGWDDAWVIHLNPTNKIKGTLFLDENLNGVKDSNEDWFSDAAIRSERTGHSRTSRPYNGFFINEVDTGSYVTTVQANRPYYNIMPASAASSFSSYFNEDSVSFAVQPIPGRQDLRVSMVAITPARPGFTASYRIFYKNVGTTTIPAGEVLLKKDGRVTLISAAPVNSSASGDTLRWSYSALAPQDTASILLRFQVPAPPAVNIGDTLTFLAIITPVAGDETPNDDTALLKQIVIGSYDPNDKTERNGGRVPSSFITKGEYLEYVIRFQNTGTDTAFNVVVRDTLDSRLDWNTLQMIAASHSYRMSIDGGNKLVWTFNDINLPDSNVNEPASHGYIVYRLRPKSTVAVNEVIHNKASIYFDFNLPVLTNDASTEVRDDLTVLPVVLVEFSGRMNGRKADLNWKTEDAASLDKFEVQRSLNGRDYATIGILNSTGSASSYNFSDDLSQLSAPVAYYRLKMVELDGKTSFSQVLVFREQGVGSQLLVYPNPVKGRAFVSFMSPAKARIELQLVDASGRLVLRRSCDIEKGNNILSLGGLERFLPGTYTLQLINGAERLSSRVVLQ
ncbi:MAG TPA: T9SS type A sorting domain-containing protein [Flavisolibacter sp.]